MACKTQLITITLVNIVALFSLQRQSVTSEGDVSTRDALQLAAATYNKAMTERRRGPCSVLQPAARST